MSFLAPSHVQVLWHPIRLQEQVMSFPSCPWCSVDIEAQRRTGSTWKGCHGRYGKTKQAHLLLSTQLKLTSDESNVVGGDSDSHRFACPSRLASSSSGCDLGPTFLPRAVQCATLTSDSPGSSMRERHVSFPRKYHRISQLHEKRPQARTEF